MLTRWMPFRRSPDEKKPKSQREKETLDKKSSDCLRCGRCCFHMRRYMNIERSLSSDSYFCRFTLTGERFVAFISKDCQDKGQDEAFLNTYPEVCPFLFPDGTWFLCAIYENRPEHCRSFICKKENNQPVTQE